MDALEALVAVGRSMESRNVHEHVIDELARMLQARVLFWHDGSAFRRWEDQRTHTLSSWALRRLLLDRRLVARRVRRRAEFWRPEQRRPRGVLSVPLGNGLVVLARGRAFRRREQQAVRAVLRFLETRLATPPSAPVPRPPAPPGRVHLPSVAEGLVGTSRAWQAVVDQLVRVAASDCPVVLLGETGTGKERLARALHACSNRSQGAFVPLNCGAVPRELVASELFGNVRGAFTGADRTRDGVFVAAHRGTLFFDEVAETPPAMQVALLRALEDRRVTPVGSARPRDVNVRVVAATHVDVESLVRTGRFREDLWHRLSVFVLRVPPLRARLEDLPLLADHILARTEGRKSLHPDALELLASYGWPGNVRELENILHAGCLLADGPELTPELLDRLLESRRMERAARHRLPPPRNSAVLAALAHGWLRTAEIAVTVGAAPRTINREIRRLLSEGLVRMEGQGRAARYGLASPSWRAMARSDASVPMPGAEPPLPPSS